MSHLSFPRKVILEPIDAAISQLAPGSFVSLNFLKLKSMFAQHGQALGEMCPLSEKETQALLSKPADSVIFQ